jgi:GT2 family glycosyltransferase/glycosyltransferase involved in cell wall biosynthesis
MKDSETSNTTHVNIYVLILNWNGWQDTIECLESVFRQDYPNFQVIVCDNDSEDGSLDQIKAWAECKLNASVPDQHPLKRFSYPAVAKPIHYTLMDQDQAESGKRPEEEGVKLHLIANRSNLGFAAGCNVGIRWALARSSFDYIWLLNNDTVIARDSLNHLVNRMSETPRAGMCGSTIFYYDKPDLVQTLGGARFNKWLGVQKNIGGGKPFDRNSIGVREIERSMAYVVGASMLVSRQFIERVGLICEDYFLYSEELDWALRGKKEFSVVYAPDSIVYHKEGRTIGTSNLPKERSRTSDYYIIKNRLAVTKKFFPYTKLTVYIGLFAALANRVRRRQWDRVAMIAKLIWADMNSLSSDDINRHMTEDNKGHRPRLLFLSAHLPSPNVPQAGQKIAFRNLKLLARDYDVYLIACVNEIESTAVTLDCERLCKEVIVCPINFTSRLKGILLKPWLPLFVAARNLSSIRAKVSQLLSCHSFERLHVEWTQMALYASSARNIPYKTILEHDVAFQSYERKARNASLPSKLFFYLEFRRLKSWELKALQRFDRILTLSVKDQSLLKKCKPESMVDVIPPYFEAEFGKPNLDSIQKEPFSLLFWGAMDRSENEEAVLWFEKEVFRTLLNTFPQSKLYIVGNKPGSKIKNLKSENIEVTGFVENPIDYFNKAQVAIVPLKYGAGIKIKSLECMYYGLPVLATEVGAEGIDADTEEGLIITDRNHYYEEIIRLISDPDLCRQLGKKASKYAAELLKNDPLL